MSEQQRMLNWWAEGDFPVHTDSRVTYLVDGRVAMLTMCRHFLKARKYIYLANWGITPDIQLVRGKDHIAGPEGSPEQEALLEELRGEGLQEDEIRFWITNELTLKAVLGYKVSQGVEVKVLVWDSNEFFSHCNPKEAHEELKAVGVQSILDDSSRGLLHHPIESLHQKISVVDGTHAFVGGIDLLIELSGDFDRWDVPMHHYAYELRKGKNNVIPHPWHDAHAIIEGPAVADVEKNFRQRWNDVVERHELSSELVVPEHPVTAPIKSNSIVQLARTIPEHTYSFSPKNGIQGIAQLYAHALANVNNFVYLENQYFWLHAYYGVDIAALGPDSSDMELNIRELGAALRRGATMSIVLPDHPNVGRGFTDAGLARLRQEAPEAAAQGRIQAFCLGTSINRDGATHYRPIYVHAKVAVIDDVWSTLGSGNLNNRGMRDDTEMNVAVLDAELAQGLRLMLMAEHLSMFDEDDLFIVARHIGHQYQRQSTDERAKEIWQTLRERLGDPLVGLQMMVERAQENLQRFKAGQPLVGHLLPYLSAEEAKAQGLKFSEEHGWIEAYM
ncbi:MAG TPA: phospholipase D family protein [Ktedonobacteraceae bacterium]|jgi:phosphatidylserine/phosphatidylglycerophosphate/cardiolipin synthase-like enzyme|nr:phospholipase D family protein [Ktedonobacteraceae bacterium]